ncbi:MAG: hypothetical protein INQ03_04190 [Candidatus Heimdallarchaeota archaeon]|nr:hypothetical protein [Candidatus Heimdallarchaeota archaeon]
MRSLIISSIIIVSLISAGIILWITNPSDEFNEFDDAEMKVDIDGNKVFISSFDIWSNDMPPIVSENRLIMVIKLAIGELDTSMLNVSSFWVIEVDGEAVWTGTFSDQDRPDCGVGCVEKYAGGGPSLESGILVYPVVMITYNGMGYLLQGPSATVFSAV